MTEEYRTSPVDDIVDDLMPIDLDWRYLVRSYPVATLAAVAVGGFLVGRKQGTSILSSLSSYVTREVTHNVRSLLGEDEPPGPNDDEL